MSVEDRLFALAQQCRQQSGDSFLRATGQFVPRLNSQAPDLHAEIRALAAAFETDAATRIAAAPDHEAAAAAIGSEIAVRERLSMHSVMPALAVARRLGPLAASAPASPSTPTPGGWAGDSMAVGATPPQAPAPPAYAPPQAPAAPHYQQPQPGYAMPTPPPAPGGESQTDKLKALTKNPLAMGALALVVGFLVYENFIKTPPTQTGVTVQGDFGGQGQGGQGQGGQGQGGQGQGGQGQGGQGQGGQGQGGQGQGGQGQGGMGGQGQGGQQGGQASMPLLTAPGAGAPTLQVQRHSSGAPAFMFTLNTQRGAAPGMVLLPQGGWQSGMVGFGLATPGDTTGQNMATLGEGQFQLIQSNGHPVRLAQLRMGQDNLGVGNICLMFRGQQGQQDVQLSGADFCVMDGPCSQPIGCGKLQ